MSENLHPKYVYDGPASGRLTNGYTEAETDGITMLVILRSGLCVASAGGFDYGTLQSSNSSSKGCSPVPKTYTFLDDNNNVVYNISYSSFTYDEDGHVGTASRDNIPSITAGTITKLIAIDPMLWVYKTFYIEGHVGVPDTDIFPIYKANGESSYHLCNSIILLPAGYYSFLTSVGALYQTQSTDLLHKYYPTDTYYVTDSQSYYKNEYSTVSIANNRDMYEYRSSGGSNTRRTKVPTKIGSHLFRRYNILSHEIIIDRDGDGADQQYTQEDPTNVFHYLSSSSSIVNDDSHRTFLFENSTKSYHVYNCYGMDDYHLRIAYVKRTNTNASFWYEKKYTQEIWRIPLNRNICGCQRKVPMTTNHQFYNLDLDRNNFGTYISGTKTIASNFEATTSYTDKLTVQSGENGGQTTFGMPSGKTLYRSGNEMIQNFINAPNSFFFIEVSCNSGYRKYIGRDGTINEVTETSTSRTFNTNYDENNYGCDIGVYALPTENNAPGGVAMFHINGFSYKITGGFFPGEQPSFNDFFDTSGSTPATPNYNSGNLSNSTPSNGSWTTGGNSAADAEIICTYNGLTVHMYGYWAPKFLYGLGDAFMDMTFRPKTKGPGLRNTYYANNLISNLNHLTKDFGKYTNKNFDYIDYNAKGSSIGATIDVGTSSNNVNDYSAIYIY